MEEWSEFQPAEYLEATRQTFLPHDFAAVAARRCGVEDHGTILEVGCGTGAFSIFLESAVTDAEFVGLDKDEVLLQFLRRHLSHYRNRFRTVCGDACGMPFPDGSFDAVCSHTFLSCVPNPKDAMREMIRVCRPGGIVSSVTAMTWEYEGGYGGVYPPGEQAWVNRFRKLYALVSGAYYRYYDGLSPAKGVPLGGIPRFFAEAGLQNISILPMGRAFSLSDAALGREEKKSYIQNRYIGERKRLEVLKSCAFPGLLIGEGILQEYEELLGKWRQFWLSNLEDNLIWEWYGGSQLLVCGEKQ